MSDTLREWSDVPHPNARKAQPLSQVDEMPKPCPICSRTMLAQTINVGGHMVTEVRHPWVPGECVLNGFGTRDVPGWNRRSPSEAPGVTELVLAARKALKSAFAGGVCVALSVVAAHNPGRNPSVEYEEIVESVGPSWLLRWAVKSGDPEVPKIRKVYRRLRDREAWDRAKRQRPILSQEPGS